MSDDDRLLVEHEKTGSYREQRVWRVGVDVAVEAYRVTAAFPRSETFGLTSQIRRAATSIPANIAEGYGRESRPDYVRFLRIAQGSLKELETHSIVAQRVGLASEDELRALFRLTDDHGRMLRGLLRSLAPPPTPTPDSRLPTPEVTP